MPSGNIRIHGIDIYGDKRADLREPGHGGGAESAVWKPGGVHEVVVTIALRSECHLLAIPGKYIVESLFKVTHIL